MDEAWPRSLVKDFSWSVKEDAGRGWRRVVSSPAAARIVELDVIQSLVGEGCIVIACGGGVGRGECRWQP
jgi:carbamate kinase